MTVHSRLKSFSFVKLIHYCTEKYLCIHLYQVYVDSSTSGCYGTCLRSACLRTLPQPGVWAASGLLAYFTQVRVRAAFPYYVLGCVFSIVLRNVVRYLLGCVPGRLRGFFLTTYPETMPPRIPVFSQDITANTGERFSCLCCLLDQHLTNDSNQLEHMS